MTIPSKVPGDGLDQYVFANRLRKPTISMIDLRTGKIVKEWDFSKLVNQQQAYVDSKAKQLTQALGPVKSKKLIEIQKSLSSLEKFRNFENLTDPESEFKHYVTFDKNNYYLNGIIYLPWDDSFLIGGKMWVNIHKVKLDYLKYIKK